jgi:hypothetical protein
MVERLELLTTLRLPYVPDNVTKLPYGGKARTHSWQQQQFSTAVSIDGKAVMHLSFDLRKLSLAVAHASGHVLVYTFGRTAQLVTFEVSLCSHHPLFLVC